MVCSEPQEAPTALTALHRSKTRQNKSPAPRFLFTLAGQTPRKGLAAPTCVCRVSDFQFVIVSLVLENL